MGGGQFYGSQSLFTIRLSQVRLDPGWSILPAPVSGAKAMEIFILLRLRPYGWAHRIKPHLGLRAMLLSARSLIPCSSKKLACAA